MNVKMPKMKDSTNVSIASMAKVYQNELRLEIILLKQLTLVTFLENHPGSIRINAGDDVISGQNGQNEILHFKQNNPASQQRSFELMETDN